MLLSLVLVLGVPRFSWGWLRSLVGPSVSCRRSGVLDGVDGQVVASIPCGVHAGCEGGSGLCLSGGLSGGLTVSLFLGEPFLELLAEELVFVLVGWPVFLRFLWSLRCEDRGGVVEAVIYALFLSPKIQIPKI